MSLNAEKTLVIIFGASKWPDYQDLNHSPTDSKHGNPYQNAAKGMRDYFLNELKIGIDNLLFLFDDRQQPGGLIKEIKSFLDRGQEDIDHLFFYFVGHGDSDQEGKYSLCTACADKGNPASLFRIEDLVNTLNNQFASRVRHCYFILDACYAGQAFPCLDKIKKISTMLFSSCHRDRTTKIMGNMPMFTQALLEVLHQGKSSTFFGVYEFVADFLKREYGKMAILPEIKDINQDNGHASRQDIIPHHSYGYANISPMISRKMVFMGRKYLWLVWMLLALVVGGVAWWFYLFYPNVIILYGGNVKPKEVGHVKAKKGTPENCLTTNFQRMLPMSWVNVQGQSVPNDLKAWVKDITDSTINESPFYIMRREVTIAEFGRYVNQLSSQQQEDLGDKWQKDSVGNLLPETRPVASVTWWAANGYAEWLSQQTQCDLALPTRHQWATAAIQYANPQNAIVRQNPNDFSVIPQSRQDDESNVVLDLLGNLREWSIEKCSENGYYLLGEDYKTNLQQIRGTPSCQMGSLRLDTSGFRLILNIGKKT